MPREGRGISPRMTLTLDRGPLSGHPPETNHDLDGPAHTLLFHDFPRRIRARPFKGDARYWTMRAGV